MNDDELQSGAGGGEAVHPDQDNATGIEVGPPSTATAEIELIPITPDDFRRAVAIVHPGDPHAAAAIERHIGDPSAYPTRSPFDRAVIDNCRLHLFRTL